MKPELSYKMQAEAFSGGFCVRGFFDFPNDLFGEKSDRDPDPWVRTVEGILLRFPVLWCFLGGFFARNSKDLHEIQRDLKKY